MKRKEELIKTVLQFIKFGIVGVLNTGISIAIYYVLVYLNIHYIIANTIRFCCKCVKFILLE